MLENTFLPSSILLVNQNQSVITNSPNSAEEILVKMVPVEDEVNVSAIVALFTLGCQFAIVLGAAFPYIPQYLQISRTGDADGFSLYVCLALLTANILRILFWFGRGFELPLLIQSILMSIVMLLMIHLCVQTKSKSEIIKKTDRSIKGSGSSSADNSGKNIPQRKFTDLDMNHFWDWTDFGSYLQCVAVFSLVGSLLMYTFSDVWQFVELVGFVAVFVEAMLGVPQFLRNKRNQSIRGMNQSMVLMWTCGDIFKTVYFVIQVAPIQFVMCGCLQIGVDLAILSQVWIYGGGNTP